VVAALDRRQVAAAPREPPIDPVARRREAVAVAHPLQLGPVASVRLRLALSAGVGGPAHDVFLVDARRADPAVPFEEGRWLVVLQDLLDRAGLDASGEGLLRVERSHALGDALPGTAEVELVLDTGAAPALPATHVEQVASALRAALGPALGGEPGEGLSRGEAIDAARRSVLLADPGADEDTLVVTDEEHLASAGRWSIGLALGTRARFEVVIGLVDGDPRTRHVRRLPGSEVVDSVGTEG
jgi:hypothetical protein